MARRIITNNVPRDILDGWELTPQEREKFDYLNWAGIDEGTDSASFFRYKGEIYDLGNFMHTSMEGWGGIETDSAFSGTLIRFVHDDYDTRIVVARIFA